MTQEESAKIETLYRETYDDLKDYAVVLLDRNESMAEEAVQETFRIACQSPDKLFGCGNPNGWLVLTLRHTVRNIKKTRAAARQLLERYLVTQAKEVTFTEDGVKLNILYENVADSEEFKLLTEMAVKQRSHKDMARDRGITVNACKKRVQRAKEILQRKI